MMDWDLAKIIIGGLISFAVSYLAFKRTEEAKITDAKFSSIDKKMEAITHDIAERAYKEEVARIEARFEKDIADLRLDQKTGFAEIRQDIKGLRTDLMDAIRSAVK